MEQVDSEHGPVVAILERVLVILLWWHRCVEVRRPLGFVIVFMLVYSGWQLASVQAETTIVPLVDVRGRYDSNVFNRPAELLPAGTQRSDFVTSVGGEVQLLHDTRDLTANFSVGGNFNAFVENPGLNFFNARVKGQISLDRWVDQYVRGAKLGITQNFRYTPETPGFVTGIRETEIEDDAFFRGIQGFRANTFANTTSIGGSYPVSRDLDLEGGYTFGLRRMGSVQGGGVAGASFFDTNSHTWFGGPRYRLTRNDSVAAIYRQTFLLQSRSEGGRSFSTNLVTLAGEYTKAFQEWSFTVEGGITFVEPAGRTFPSGALKVTTHPERDTVIHVTLSRQARPSFFLGGGALISNLGRVGISHRIYERLTVEGSAAYGYNQLFPDTDQTFKNFTASSGLHYNLTRNITGNFLYTFINIDVDRTDIAYQVSRHQVGFFLTAAWK